MSTETLLEERLAELELALESLDWRRLTNLAEQEFSRQGLRDIVDICRVMYLKNPLIKRLVTTKRLYVFGQGLTVAAKEQEIDQALTRFWTDAKNQVELTGHAAMGQKEVELQTDGNLFLVFFTNRLSGRVRVRSVTVDEIEEIRCDPDDAKWPHFYRRTWVEQRGGEMTQRTAWYPALTYTPTARPTTVEGIEVRWNEPLLHVRVGGFSHWRFGLPEFYDGVDWAKAYKDFLEDWSSIVRAYRRFAFQLSTPGGKSAVAAAKSRLASTLSSGAEGNPSPVVGSTFVAGEGVNLQPVRTSGATVGAEDGRRLLLMVAASSGLPETFFGDASVGTLATARSLDRPTELMMRDRQAFWADVLRQIHDYVLLWAVKAPQGSLRQIGRVLTEVDGDEISEYVFWDRGIDPHVAIEWPAVVEANTLEQVQAVTAAATVGGQAFAAIDVATISRLLLTALGVSDVDEVLAQLETDGEPDDTPASEALMVEAVRELRAALRRIGV